jgi:DNA-binding PadR family transcriptional regulator
MHGYELIQALGERFGGTYVPSAGTIYPRLAKLEEEGLVTKAADGRKTVYAITEAGRTELASREHELDGIENDVTDSVRRLAEEVRSSVNDAMRTLRADLAAAAQEARTEARATHQSVRVDVNSEGLAQRMQLQRADSALTDFRGAMRTALRVQAAQGGLKAEVVQQLVTGLDDLRSSITRALKN